MKDKIDVLIGRALDMLAGAGLLAFSIFVMEARGWFK